MKHIRPVPGMDAPLDDTTAQTRPPARRRWRRAVGLAALLALLLGGGIAYRASLAGAPGPEVMTAPVVRGDIEDAVLATGVLKPARLVAVGAQVSGRITRLAVAIGDEVKAGDLIAEIDSIPQKNALRTAEASLAEVKAQKAEKAATLGNLERTLARQTALADRRTIAQADLETAQGDVAVTKAQIEALDAGIAAAEVAIETARVNLGYTRITAPIDGTVLAVSAQQGQTVNAAQTTPTIVVLGDLDTMAVHAEISEADVTRVSPGQEVYFTILGDRGTRYSASLASIAPAPESITEDSSLGLTGTASASSTSTSAIYYDGIFEVPNPDRHLRTYMTAEVHVVHASAPDVLAIPLTALGPATADGSRTVQVLGPDGTISTRRVETGVMDRSNAEVRSGLSEGERVVIGTRTGAGSAPAAGPRMPRAPMGL